MVFRHQEHLAAIDLTELDIDLEVSSTYDDIKDSLRIFCEAMELASLFYIQRGYNKLIAFKWYESQHGDEQMVWNCVKIVYDQLYDTDLDIVLEDLGERCLFYTR